MSRQTEVKRGTRKYSALVLLYAVGGEMEYDDWVDQNWAGNPEIFRREVADFLLKLKMIHIDGERVMMMNAGLWAIGKSTSDPTCSTAAVAGPRMPAPSRPLAKNRMMRPLVSRPGAFDYATIPSLMAGQRVPHHAFNDAEVGTE